MGEGCGAYPQIGRKTPARGAHVFLGRPNVFFVTVNAKDKLPWIGQKEVQLSLESIWRDQATAWLVGYYLLMPDHLHLFCSPHDLKIDIDPWIAYWKSRFSRQHLGRDWEWQRRAFHHRLRNRIECEEKLQYVRENPLRKHLAKTVEEWPLQGRVHDLLWTAD